MTSTIDLFQLSPLPMWIFDINTRFFLDVNEAAMHLFGYSRKEFLGLTVDDLKVREGQPRDKTIEHLILNGLDKETQLLKKKNGERVYTHVVSNPVEFQEKKGELELVTDLTERIESERKMLESSERFNIVSKATSDTIWDWNLTSGSIIWNRGIKGIFGHKSIINHTTTMSWRYDHIHPEDRERVVLKIQEHIDQKIERWQDEYRFMCGNGSYRYVFDRGFVLFDESGSPIRAIGAMEDITRRKEYIRAIEDQNKKFKEIAWIQSHMVRAPLARIMALVDLIKDYGPDSDYDVMLQHLASSAKELDAIIVNIADRTP
ncbi:PAS domain S-box protein [Pedobacter sp.]|jgi:PAS domain S-box-containing protein|uniref:PAS domain-containing protein n=1 Tax=Pedobacter sp. TaxID=1411316 RepID=UPI002CC01526|nr:PAS domain S-box protein [Pedobacter sp.]HWW38145.1 PAS domain S-box protein [Pedobacter sp.]